MRRISRILWFLCPKHVRYTSRHVSQIPRVHFALEHLNYNLPQLRYVLRTRPQHRVQVVYFP